MAVLAAGDVDVVVWRPLKKMSEWFKQNWCRGRNVTETSLTVPELRPDFAVLALYGTLQLRRLIFKGEVKTLASELNTAMWELAAKMRGWSALYFGKVSMGVTSRCVDQYLYQVVCRMGQQHSRDRQVA